MGSNYIYEPVVQTFTNVDTVTVTHNFGRKVNMKVYISDKPVIAEIDITDDNSFTAKFYEKGALATKSGYIVVS